MTYILPSTEIHSVLSGPWDGVETWPFPLLSLLACTTALLELLCPFNGFFPAQPRQYLTIQNRPDALPAAQPTESKH